MLIEVFTYLLNKLIIVQKPEKEKKNLLPLHQFIHVHSTAMIEVYKLKPGNKCDIM